MRLSLLLTGLFLVSIAFSQNAELDSLLRTLPTVTSAEDSINIHYRLAWLMANNNNAEAIRHSHDGLAQSLKLKDDRLIAIGYGRVGLMYRVAGEADSAIVYLKQGVSYAEKMSNPLFPTGMLFNLGVAYSMKGDYEKALDYYYQCKEINSANNYEVGNGDCLNSIAIINRKIGKKSEALEKYKEALSIFEKAERKWDQANVLSNIGNLFRDDDQLDSALHYYRRANVFNLEVGDKWGQCKNDAAVGTLMMKREEFSEAEKYLTSSKTLADSLDLPLEKTEAIALLGENSLRLNRLDEATSRLEEALALTKEYGFVELESEIRMVRSELFQAKGEFEKAYDETLIYSELRDSLINEKRLENMNELEIRFETAEKDKQLAEQQLAIEIGSAEIQRQSFNKKLAWLAFALVALILIGIILNYQQKRKLDAQKMDALHKEKQLASIQAFVNGEEKERMRIAKDLHDGLNGLLAGTKLQFSSVKNSVSEEGTQHFEEALKSLDNASTEVRRIAHNMMPQDLLRFGLVKALQSYFGTINSSQQLKIELQHYGLEERVPESVELVIYRIILELTNNIIKHANATEALVQLNRTGELLSITVEDNGVGFDPSTKESKEGMGMSNLQSRVDFLEGELNIESSNEKGTFVYIELQLNKRTQ